MSDAALTRPPWTCSGEANSGVPAKPGESVPVVVLTHAAREAQVRQALEQIDRMADVRAPTRLIRIEEEA